MAPVRGPARESPAVTSGSPRSLTHGRMQSEPALARHLLTRAISMRMALGFSAIVAFVLAQNLFGRTLNAWFLEFPGIDKVLHFVEFAVLFVVQSALLRGVVEPTRRRLAVAWVLGVVLAFGDEFVQSFTLSRNVEAFDVIADAAGLTIGWVLTSSFRRALLLPALGALGAVSYVAYDTHTRLIDFSRGLRYERARDFVKAREHLHRALQSGMRSTALYNELGWVEIESGVGDPAQAVTWAEIALDARPTDPDVLDTYGWALHHAGRSTEARPALEQAFALKPKMFCIHYHLGAVYAALGERDRAAMHFREQIALPNTREATLAKQALLEIEHRSEGP